MGIGTPAIHHPGHCGMAQHMRADVVNLSTLRCGLKTRLDAGHGLAAVLDHMGARHGRPAAHCQPHDDLDLQPIVQAPAIPRATRSLRQAATRGGVLGMYQRASSWPEQVNAMKLWAQLHARRLSETQRLRRTGASESC